MTLFICEKKDSSACLMAQFLRNAESRVILTFDLDFGEIIALSGGKRVSAILFRLHNTRTPHVMERLKKVLKDSGKDLEKGAIVVVEESRHRTRRLPIGTKGAD